MQVNDLIEMLEQTGLPVAYAHYPIKKAPEPPYIAVVESGSQNFFADNVTFVPIRNYEIELCTEFKDPPTEKKITDIFDMNNIPWEKTDEGFVENDGLFSIFYEIGGIK